MVFTQTILSNGTITSSGSSTAYIGYGNGQTSLVINVTGPVTGSSPTITFTIQEVDPGNQTTVLGASKTGAAITGVSSQIITIPNLTTGNIIISWTVTGSSPSFGGIYASLTDRLSSPYIYDAAGNGPAAVKAASTAAVATDPALVVAVSPNNTIAATQSGTWTVQPGNTANTTPWLVTDSSDGPVTPGTVATKSSLIGGQYNSTLPTLTTGQQAAIQVDSSGRIIVAPSGSGTTTGISIGTVSTAATTNVAVRATTYTEQASNAQRSISSSSASDTSAGTGARQVKITYYDSTGAGPSTETVTLNGTTSVATVSSTICFIEKLEVTSVGSGGTNVGTISLFVNNAGGGGTIGTIAVGDNQTLWAHHYVATSKSCYISGLTGNNNNSSNGTILTIKSKAIAANAPENQVSDFFRVGGSTAQSTRIYGTPIKITGPARITIFGAPEGSPNIITRAGMDFYDQ